MQTLLLESTLRVTLIAAVIALVLCIMRIKTASARHAVWAGVVVLMLLLPAWVAWGPKARVPVLPSQASAAIAAVDVVPPPLPVKLKEHSASPVREDGGSTWREIPVIGIYLLGMFVLLLRLAIGTVRASRLTLGSCIVPVTVGVLRPRIILPENSREWPQAQLDAVLMHEREHARRRDPLFQWLALLNRAIFWFHPLAWWLERKLAGLAEEACDAAVLAQGHDPQQYSEYLLDLARSVERAGSRVEVVGLAMPGAFLPHRIRRMLSGVPLPQISRPRLACAAAVCALAAAILAAGTLVRAQSKAQFEVASVKPSNPNTGGGDGKSKSGGGGGLRPGLDHRRLTLPSTLFRLIAQAYGIRGCGPKTDCVLITGGPDWIRKDAFDLQAKMPDDSPDYTMAQFRDGKAPQLELMLQALLAERFNLKFHRETKELPVYVLTVVKKGPKLETAKGEKVQAKDGTFVTNRSMLWTFPRQANGEFNQSAVQMLVRDRSIQELTDALSGLADRPVLNRTGLTGEFDITMQYDRDTDGPDDAGPGGGLFGPTMFKAFQNELGLKFESTKGPVDVLVIDHAEKPSEN